MLKLRQEADGDYANQLPYEVEQPEASWWEQKPTFEFPKKKIYRKNQNVF